MTDQPSASNGRELRELVQLLDLRLEPQPAARHAPPANDATYAGVGVRDLFRVCGDGERTPHLTHLAGTLIGEGLDAALATGCCLAWNASNTPPLLEDKVRDTVASIARTHVRNHPTGAPLDTPLFDLAAASVARFIGKAVPERDWVLKDCLPMGKTAMLVAPGGTGKSQFVLQLAYDIAIGRKCFSPWTPGKAGQVLVIGAEDEDEEYHRRLERLLRAHALDLREDGYEAALKENLYIVSRVGEDNLLTRAHGKEVSQTGLDERIAKAVESLTNLRLIVLDPVSRFRGGEENAAEDTTRFVEVAEKLVKQTGAALLLVHHANKNSMQGGEQNQAASRGSSALTDGVRLQINLSYPTSQELSSRNAAPGKYLVAKITKTNYSAAGEPIYLRKEDGGRLTPVDINQVHQTQEEAQVERLVETLRLDASAGRSYSKSSFAHTYGGRDKRFGVGETKLKGVVDRAICDGRVEMLPGKANLLRVRELVPIARVGPVSPLNDGRSE